VPEKLPAVHPANSTLEQLEYSEMPAVIVETAFLSNAGDRAKLTDPYWQDKIAQSIDRGINSYWCGRVSCEWQDE